MRLDDAELMFPPGMRVKCARSKIPFTVECYRRRNSYDKLDVIGTSPDSHIVGYLSWCGHSASQDYRPVFKMDEATASRSGLRRSGRVRFD